jgi:hypothetical protein
MGNVAGSHTVEGEHMRKLMGLFDDRKRKFKKDSKEFHIDLPGPLSNLDIRDKVFKGEITITRYVSRKESSTYSLGPTWRRSSKPP